MTRYELSTILSAQTPSRTILADGEYGEVSDQSEVLFLEVENNTLIIHCKGSMKKYEVIEDNGGGLTLVVFGENDNVEYLHSGYEYGSRGHLLEDLQTLKDGDNPVTDWEGNEENPQAVYDNIKSYEYGWKVVADNDGIYHDRMGAAAQYEFNK